MKKFLCNSLRGISMAGSFAGFILMASEAIETPYALMIMFGFMFLGFFVEWVDDVTETKDNPGTKECDV